MTDLIKTFAEHSLLGVAVVALTLLLLRKDRQVTTLYNRLVTKSEKQSLKYHELAKELDDTLREILEKQRHEE